MNRKQAEIFSLQALGWLAGDEDLLPVFLGASGMGAEDLRTRAGDAEFLGALLDFLMMDDKWVIACCEALGVPGQTVRQARLALPGGAQMDWS